VRRRIALLDRAAARRVAASGSWPSEHVLPGLSRLADHGFLWMVLAAVLRATGNRQARRAAWRGLASMAAARTAANVIGKGLTGRPYADVPVRSRLRRVPRSSSFPSGHAANAAAFAIGAADLGVESARGALAALRDGEAVQVDLGLVGGRPFVNTSSTGV